MTKVNTRTGSDERCKSEEGREHCHYGGTESLPALVRPNTGVDGEGS